MEGIKLKMNNLNVKFWEELSPTFFWYFADHIENIS
jgi:hypothetical protein